MEEFVMTVKRNRSLEKEVILDELTGLYNRQYIHKKIDSLICNNETQNSHLLFLDLDGFKGINDLVIDNLFIPIIKHCFGTDIINLSGIYCLKITMSQDRKRCKDYQ